LCFHHGTGVPATPDNPAGLCIADDFHDMLSPVQEDQIQRESHEERMDHATGLDEQTLSGVEPSSSDQSDGAPSEGVGDIELGHDNAGIP